MSDERSQFILISCFDNRQYTGWLDSITGNNYNISSANPATGRRMAVSIPTSEIYRIWSVTGWILIFS